jgi:hypothetical protein
MVVSGHLLTNLAEGVQTMGWGDFLGTEDKQMEGQWFSKVQMFPLIAIFHSAPFAHYDVTI